METEQNLEIKNLESLIRHRQFNVNEHLRVIKHHEKNYFKPTVPKKVEQAGDFYDIVIKIDSVRQLLEQCEVTINGDKYNQHKDIETLVIGVLGQFNKGKTHIISKLSKFEGLPTGFSISTEGISIKYPVDEKRKITLLDIAGFETSIKYKNSKDIMNYIDRIHTENFLKKYVLTNSDVVIYVVNILTYTDQRMLSRVKYILNQIGKSTGKKKSLYVFHNLSQLSTRTQVEDYVNDVLKPSIKLKSEKSESVSEYGVKLELEFFKEVLDGEESSIIVNHFLLAKDDTEAGNYYNIPLYDRMYSVIFSSTKSSFKFKKFDPVKELMTQFKTDFNTIFSNMTITDGPIFNGKDLIISKVKGALKFQNVLIDDLGAFKSTINVENFWVMRSNSALIIVLEVPRCDKGTVQLEEHRFEESMKIVIKGRRKPFELPEGFKLYRTNLDDDDQFICEFELPYDEQLLGLDIKKFENEFNSGMLTVSIQIYE
jgi:hypothetical protein